MKARIIATGEIIEVSQGIYSPYQYVGDNGAIYTEEEIEILQEVLDSTIDYWTRLEHQYAGMAMQGILSNPEYVHSLVQRVASREIPNLSEGITKHSEQLAHDLVEKYKKEADR